MSTVNSATTTSPIQQIAAKPVQREVSIETAVTLPRTDKVELSGISHLLQALKTNEIRTDKVADIRAQLESGKYETDEKLGAAADRLLDDLLK